MDLISFLHGNPIEITLYVNWLSPENQACLWSVSVLVITFQKIFLVFIFACKKQMAQPLVLKQEPYMFENMLSLGIWFIRYGYDHTVVVSQRYNEFNILTLIGLCAKECLSCHFPEVSNMFWCLHVLPI